MYELEASLQVKGMIAGLGTVSIAVCYESAKDSQDSGLQTSTPAVSVAQATPKPNVGAATVDARLRARC